jgi:hypothetical protein
MCEIKLLSGSKTLFYDFYYKLIKEMKEDKEVGASEVGSNKY